MPGGQRSDRAGSGVPSGGPAAEEAPSRPAEEAPSRPAESPARRRSYWLPAVVALAVLTAIGAAVGAGDISHPAPRTLAGGEVASQIALGMQARYGLAAPPRVSCPASEPARAGRRFRCTVTTGGSVRVVEVVEVDGRGRLSWQLAGGSAPAGGG